MRRLSTLHGRFLARIWILETSDGRWPCCLASAGRVLLHQLIDPHEVHDQVGVSWSGPTIVQVGVDCLTRDVSIGRDAFSAHRVERVYVRKGHT